MKVQDVITRVALLLEDRDNLRWTVPELIGWVNDAQRVIFIARPDVSTITESVKLVAGTKQTLPAGSSRLLDIVRNMGLNGQSPGNAIRYVDREMLDSTMVGWHNSTRTDTVKNFVYDNRVPNLYYVYPPSLGTTFIEVVYTKVPAEVRNLVDNLTVPDVYFDAIVNYVMYRSYSKDTELTQNPSLAGMYMQAFDRLLGGQKSSDVAYSPDLNSKGSSPPVGIQAGGV